MHAERFSRIKSLFDALIDQSEDDRATVLEYLRAQGGETQRKLQDLLAADAKVGERTARPAIRFAASGGEASWIGRRIGAFQIEREIGRGGMGSVMLAKRSDGTVEQRVAIKIIRPERVDAGTLARFRLERQVLAVLQHPHIATMLDAGELDDGSPYAVMEYVDGTPLTEYARDRGLGLRERLELLVLVCEAVAYAHRNMIVHRDIKPGNVLVSADGRPSLLDFGIAKPLLGQLGNIDVAETGDAQQFFSPDYAAPEQLRGGPITTACDVYGLGALLYELLSGSPLFPDRAASLSELTQRICHIDPPLMSQAFAKRDQQQHSMGKGAAPHRGYTPRELEGDLDAIAARSLRKEALQRYATVDDMVADIRSYLSGHPVRARSGNLVYRARKLVLRHRLASATLLVAVFVGAIAALALWRQYRETIRERAHAEQVTQLLLGAFKSVDPRQSLGAKVSAGDVMRQATRLIGSTQSLEPENRARLINTIAEVELSLGQPDIALQHLDADDARPDASWLPAGIRIQRHALRTQALTTLGQFDEAAAALKQGKALARSAQEIRTFAFLEINLLYSRGDFASAFPLIDAFLANPLGSADPADPYRHRVRIQQAESRAMNNDMLGGMSALRMLVADERRTLPPDHPNLLESLSSASQMAVDLDRADEALPLAEEAMASAARVYGETSLASASASGTLANVYFMLGRNDDAVRLHQQAMDIRLPILGPRHPRIATGHYNIALVQQRSAATWPLARQHFDQAIALGEELWPAAHTNLNLFRSVYACGLIRHADFAAAIVHLKKSLDAAAGDEELRSTELYPIDTLALAIAEYGQNPAPDRLARVHRLHQEFQSVESSAAGRAAIANAMQAIPPA
jgi:eukaryotic-like serine/threonine-protein kinase